MKKIYLSKLLSYLLVTSLVFGLVSGISIPKVLAATAFGTNLIVNNNPNTTDNLNGWTSDSIYFTVYDEAGSYVESPDGGAVFDFYDSNGTYGPATLSQAINISDIASLVDTGGVGFNLSGYLLKFLTASQAIIRVEMYDASGAQIPEGTHELVNDGTETPIGSGNPSWQFKSINNVPIIAGTRSLKVTLYALVSTNGLTTEYIDFDNIQLSLSYIPAMTVSYGNTGIAIHNGDITPDSGDYTDLGYTDVGTSHDWEYTITNTGLADLVFTDTTAVPLSGTGISDFSSSAIGDGTLSPGETTTFTISYAPASRGSKSVQASIPNNTFEGSYAFTLKGTGKAPVEDFASSAVTDTTAAFTWSQVTNATNIAILKSTDGGITWSSAQTGTIHTADTQAVVTGLTEGTNYKFCLEVTGGEYQGKSNVVGTKTKKPISDFANSVNTTTTAAFTWTAAADASEVAIWQSSDGGSTYSKAATGTLAANANHATVTGLLPGNTYLFRLVVTGGDNEGNSNMITVDSTVPSLLYQSATRTTSSVTLNWSIGENEATNVTIQKSEDGGNTWEDAVTAISNSGQVTAAVSGLIEGTTYQFRLVIPSWGLAGISDPVEITTISPVDTFSAVSRTTDTVSFEWNALSGASSVRIEQSADGGITWITSATKAGYIDANAENATVTGLNDNTAYQFRLIVTGGDNDGTSNIVEDTTSRPIRNFKMIDKGTDFITLSWENDGLMEFDIEISTDGGINWSQFSDSSFNGTHILSAGIQILTMQELSPGVTYNIRLVSRRDLTNGVTGLHEGTFYLAAPVTTDSEPVSDLDYTSKTYDSVSLGWTQVTNATSIQLQQSKDDGVTWNPAVTDAIGTDATGITVSGLSANTQYKFRLVVTGGVNAGISNELTLTTEVKPITDFAFIFSTDTMAGFSWAKAEGATSLRLEQAVYTSPSNPTPPVLLTWTEAATAAPLTAESTQAVVTGLSVDTVYKFRLVVAGGNNEGNSNEIFAFTHYTAPTDITLSNDSIAENEPEGTLIGTITGIDADTTDHLTYSLLEEGTDHSSFTISGNRLFSAAPFDYETKSTYSIIIRVVDAVGSYYDKTFTIKVNDVGETAAEPVLNPNSVTYDKNTSSPDNGDKSIQVTSTTDLLYIENGSGILTAGYDFTYVGGTVTLFKDYLETLDKGTAELTFYFLSGQTKTVSINVTDTSPPPEVQNPAVLSQTKATYNKYTKSSNHKDIEVTITLNGTTFTGILNGSTVLTEGKDYSVVSGSAVTASAIQVSIHSAYFEGLVNGTTNLTFTFDSGENQNLAVSIVNKKPSSNSSNNSGSSAKTETRDASVEAGEGNNVSEAVQVPISRTIAGDGSVVDSIEFTKSQGTAAVSAAVTNQSSMVTLDLSSNNLERADIAKVTFSKEVNTLFSQNHMGLKIVTDLAALQMPAETLWSLEALDVDITISEVTDDTQIANTKAILLQLAAGGKMMSNPIRIVTNYAKGTQVTLPIDSRMIPADQKELDEFIASLAVLVEHSDGEIRLQKGTLTYDAYGKPAAISIWVDKFSTFTLVQTSFTGTEKILKNKQMPDKVLHVNLNGEIDTATVTEDNVYVLDSKGNKVDVTLESDGSKLIITPVNYYALGETYTLYITQNVHYKNGEALENARKYQFTIGNVALSASEIKTSR